MRILLKTLTSLLVLLSAAAYGQEALFFSGNGSFLSVPSITSENYYCPPNEVPTWVADGPASAPGTCNYTARSASPSNGTVRTVNTLSDLSVAGVAAVCGDVIELTAGITIAVNYVLPLKACDSTHWLTIRSSGMSSFPAESLRATPCYWGVASLAGRPSYPCSVPTKYGATLQGLTTGNKQPFAFTSGSKYIRIEGIEFSADPTNTGVITPLIVTDTGVASGLDHVILDQTWCHGNELDEVQRCTILVNSNHISFVNSYLNNFHCISVTGHCSDAQALTSGTGGSSTDGTYKVYNNFLEASGENFLTGGTGGSSTPFDFEFRQNHFFKPLTWNSADVSYNGGSGGHAFIVKNIFEVKNGTRMLVEGNVLENNWSGFSQVGEAITITPANQSGNCPTCFASNLIFRYNKIRDVLQVFQIANPVTNGTIKAAAGNSYIFHDNVADNVDAANACGAGCSSTNLGAATAYSGRELLSGDPLVMHDVKFDHNTIVIATVTPSGTWPVNSMLLDGPSGTALQDKFTSTNSIFTAGANAVGSVFGAPGGCANGQAMSSLTNWLNACWITWTFDHNAIVGGIHSGWNFPSNGGVAFPVTYNDLGFVNLNNGSGGDYRLCTGVNLPAAPCAGASAYHNAASDGKDIGADVATVNSITANVAP